MKKINLSSTDEASSIIDDMKGDIAYLVHISQSCCIAKEFREEYGPQMAERLGALKEFIKQCDAQPAAT